MTKPKKPQAHTNGTGTRMHHTVRVELDRPRNMRLTLRDALAYQEATRTPERPRGISLFFGDVPPEEGDWLRLIHQALVWEDPDLTVEQIPDLIDVWQMKAVHEALTDLLTGFRPAGGAGEPGPSGTA